MIAVLLILVPLLTGFASFFIKNEKTVRSWALFSSLVTLGVSLTGLIWLKDPKYLSHTCEWLPALGSSFSVKLDGLGLLLTLLNAISFPVIFIATWNTPYRKANNFFALMLLGQAGMMGVFLAMDALLFYFFWELALIPMYFLCSQWGGEKRIAVTFKFFIYTFVGSLLMLIGILYLYNKTTSHSFSIQAFYDAGATLSAKQQNLVFWLMFIAFAIKMPIFPLHTWQPDTYEQAPTATTMALSGVMVKMGVFGVLRWLFPIVSGAAFQWGDFLTPLSIIGMIYASLIALRQDDMKRLIAYSSIAHIGLLSAGLFTQNTSGLQGVMIQMFSHGINIIGLWIVVEWIERKTGTRKLSQLGGLAQTAPSLAVFFVIIALANIALPLTNAFVGEFLIFNGILSSYTQYYLWFTVMAGICIILGAAYTLRMVRKAAYGNTNEITGAVTDISLSEKVALGIIVLLIFCIGVFPQPMLDLTSGVTESIANKFEVIRYPVVMPK
ncbi:MAG TPA: NADH-quinone oxidoreductase subunit M [Chitinophagaceae bacterium]|nr:NADH-quinone oxidoreductase subunit M [Chitinophagaceae bacterium]